MPATIDEHPYARKYADLLVARSLPYSCPACGKSFPVARADGTASVVCPACGYLHDDSVFRNALRMIADSDEREKRQQAQIAAALAPEPESAPRCDPPGLDDVIGNAGAVRQIRTALAAHKARDGKHAFPHTLFAGSGGTGKTMLSEIIAREIGRPMRLQMGQSLTNPARVADVLLSLKAHDVLFIDEMHGLRDVCQETLYRAMEDGLLVPVAKAGSPVGKPIQLPPFTVIGSTTDEWGLLPSLLQRFKYRVTMERMTADDLFGALLQRAKRKDWNLSGDAASMIAERSRGTPRLAVGLMDGCMDTAVANGWKDIDADVVKLTCDIWQIDGLGLDRTARKYLRFLDEAGGGPVRLNVLAMKLDGLSRRTVETRVEPDLVWLGLIEKRTDGRYITAAGREHLRKGA